VKHQGNNIQHQKYLQKRATPEGLHKAQYEYEDLAKGFAQVASKKRVVGSPQAHE
jgi:hypothetical protein